MCWPLGQGTSPAYWSAIVVGTERAQTTICFRLTAMERRTDIAGCVSLLVSVVVLCAFVLVTNWSLMCTLRRLSAVHEIRLRQFISAERATPKAHAISEGRARSVKVWR